MVIELPSPLKRSC